MKRLLQAGAVLVCVGIISAVILNRQLLRDNFIVHTTDVAANAAAVQDNLQLTPKGNFLFEASQPELQPAAPFNASCGNVAREQSIVLGCYSRQKIFVYDVRDSRLSGVKEVTAAHELLHAAYERLDTTERTRLHGLLRAEETKVTDQRLKDTIAQYQRTEPADVLNELHSIFGTELAQLSPELEAHYKTYFTDRQKIVAYANQYESTFTAIDSQIKTYDDQLVNLRNQKTQLESILAQQQSELQAERTRLATLRQQNQVDEYNAAVPGYNLKIQAYNQTIDDLRSLVTQYNDVVTKRNQVAAAQNDLVEKLDSTYQKF